MRYVRYAVLIVLAVCLITIALANREPVTLQLLPSQLSGFLGWSWAVTLPLFLVVLGCVAAGVLFGFIWEWLREHKHRADAARQRRQKENLQREVRKMKTRKSGQGDDVLAMLE